MLANPLARVLSRANPALASLPEWFTSFRPHQINAIREILDAYDSDIAMVVLDAPTGSGKTLIAESVRRILGWSGAYLCSTKTLQDQFYRDFPYSAVLKGRSNYTPTDAPRGLSVDCSDCDKQTGDDGDVFCRWCPVVKDCPYEVAKARALAGQLAVLNTSYWLTETNGPGAFSRRHGLVVVDEADLLESELMRRVQVEIRARRAKEWGIQPPTKVTVADAWPPWCAETLSALQVALSRARKNVGEVRGLREVKQLQGLVESVRGLAAGLGDEDQKWVYTGREQEISFKPVKVDTMGGRMVWRHGSRWLLMSATVISPEQMLEDVGWEGEFRVVRVGSTFAKENRKVVVRPVAAFRHSEKLTQWPLLADAVERILADHPDDRILVHTVSYALSAWLIEMVKLVGRDAFTYSDSSGRQEALDSYLASDNGVLFASSMDRGVDLPGDACRVQVIAKVPFLNLGDRQVSARLHARDGQLWYTIQAVRSLVQMTGRAVRSKEDWAVSYILDKQFDDNIMNKGGRRLLPDWWRESLVYNQREEHR